MIPMLMTCQKKVTMTGRYAIYPYDQHPPPGNHRSAGGHRVRPGVSSHAWSKTEQQSLLYQQRYLEGGFLGVVVVDVGWICDGCLKAIDDCSCGCCCCDRD